MKYVRLGKTGLKVSRICLGCQPLGTHITHPWALDDADGRALMKHALDSGINYFDTSNSYGRGASEENLGRYIRDLARREEVVIATKVYMKFGRPDPNAGGLSRKAIMYEIDASLRRLGMDYVDVYQIHRWDDSTPIEETLEALHDLIKSGKVRYIGASSMFAWQLCKALYTADRLRLSRFVVMQTHYNLLAREDEREMLPLCLAEGIGVVLWSPLARGLLTRDPDMPTTDPRAGVDKLPDTLYTATREVDRAIFKRVGEVAAARGVSRAQVATAWLLSNPAVTAPIIGAMQPSHIDDAVAATDLELTPEEIRSLEEPYTPRAVVSGY